VRVLHTAFELSGPGTLAEELPFDDVPLP